MKFHKEHRSFTIRTIIDWQRNGKLNLSPGFQRESVWNDVDCMMLIDTILKGMPLPNLFFWQNKQGRRIVYDVIDGKQRIEAILKFTRGRSLRYVDSAPKEHPEWNCPDKDSWTWREINQLEPGITRRFLSYEIPVVIVKGDLADIEQVFIRINSTGTKLTPQEIRHAKWYNNSGVLMAAEEIARSPKYKSYFIDLGILSEGQITRMKAVEMISEFMFSIERHNVLDRKKAIDQIMSAAPINGHTVGRLAKEVRSVLDIIKSSFPDLKTSRFRKPSDFYALFFVMWELKRDGYVVKDKMASKTAFMVLNQIGLELADYAESSRSGTRKALRSPAKEYHATVLEGTDSARHRKERVKIIANILTSIFPKKDSRRQFSQEQKQLLWHSVEEKRCSNQDCSVKGGKVLTWDDVQIDHITPFSKAGKTDLRNAQLMCAQCNQRLGAKN